MKKPLLSDEVLEELERERLARIPVRFGYEEPEQIDLEDYWDDEEGEDWEETYHGYEEGHTMRIPVSPSLVKSRRIESVKKEAFGAKLNNILFWIVLLLILFLLAVIYW